MCNTYKIVRFFAPHRSEEKFVVMEGLTLEEAQYHCEQERTREEGEWFDGYMEE